MAETTGPKLAGTSWEVTAIRGTSAMPGMGTRKAELSFTEDGQIGFTGGCNRMMGPYELMPADGVRFGDPNVRAFAGTKMACPGELMAQDDALAEALLAATRLEPAGGGWRLLDAEGAEMVRLEPGTAT
jgi:heat shock protein HslJ